MANNKFTTEFVAPQMAAGETMNKYMAAFSGDATTTSVSLGSFAGEQRSKDGVHHSATTRFPLGADSVC